MTAKKYLLILFLLLLNKTLFAQDVIEWTPEYKLTLSDFQSTSTEIGGDMYSLYSTARIDFAYQMSAYEFMFTKNFNSKVSCTFTRKAALLVAPDQETARQLVQFAQYEFDLTELYARKFRKKITENKGTFSNASFFQPLFDELEKERVIRHTQAAKETDLGRNEEQLHIVHEAVLSEIEQLADYCKSCKPRKRGK